jgi:hypothetical protein
MNEMFKMKYRYHHGSRVCELWENDANIQIAQTPDREIQMYISMPGKGGYFNKLSDITFYE